MAGINLRGYSSGLPWTPKVRQKDVDTFLEVARLKFVGYKLQGDRESLAGLPQPIHEGVTTLKKVRLHALNTFYRSNPHSAFAILIVIYFSICTRP